jgi:hypothetical protein
LPEEFVNLMQRIVLDNIAFLPTVPQSVILYLLVINVSPSWNSSLRPERMQIAASVNKNRTHMPIIAQVITPHLFSLIAPWAQVSIKSTLSLSSLFKGKFVRCCLRCGHITYSQIVAFAFKRTTRPDVYLMTHTHTQFAWSM